MTAEQDAATFAPGKAPSDAVRRVLTHYTNPQEGVAAVVRARVILGYVAPTFTAEQVDEQSCLLAIASAYGRGVTLADADAWYKPLGVLAGWFVAAGWSLEDAVAAKGRDGILDELATSIAFL